MAWVVLRVVWGRVCRVLRFLSRSGAYAEDLAVTLGWSSRVVGSFAVTGWQAWGGVYGTATSKKIPFLYDRPRVLIDIKAWAGVIK